MASPHHMTLALTAAIPFAAPVSSLLSSLFIVRLLPLSVLVHASVFAVRVAIYGIALLDVYGPLTHKTIKKTDKILEETKRLLASSEDQQSIFSPEHDMLVADLLELETTLASFKETLKEGIKITPSNLRKQQEIFKAVVEFRNKVSDYIPTRIDPFTLKYEEAFQNSGTAAIPTAPRPAPPRYEEVDAVSLVLGPLVWGEDIAGQVRALFPLMPQGYTGDYRITATAADEPNMALMQFPTAEDALAFQNSWNAEPPEEYKLVRVSMAEQPDLVGSEE
ncbi:hypothetical protein DFH09DRAFT_1362056 [Mycena vulgaris]|nr:hypothetical protein DFH09DRAFT_1362056 [Mycena vulgaris]